MIFPRARIIQFARYPELGKVKTRLENALPTNVIYRLHCQLVRHVNRQLFSADLAPVDLWYGCDSPVPQGDRFLGSLNSVSIYHQAGRDLGEKMHYAFRQTLVPAGEADSALLVGSDCPFIDKAILLDALRALSVGVDVVLGPAEDGGYYLIGLRRADWDLFDGVSWGTNNVLAETLDRVGRKRLKSQLLAKLPDIDRPEDIPKLAEKSEFDWLQIE